MPFCARLFHIRPTKNYWFCENDVTDIDCTIFFDRACREKKKKKVVFVHA